jgi:hypothetical protein
VVLAITSAAGWREVSAHRLDEYLQATRLALSPDRIEAAIDLTPGVEIALNLRQTIDADRDGTISPDEARQYVAEIVGHLTIRLDGVPLALTLERYEFPSEARLESGIGTIRLEASTPLPRSSGSHQLSFENAHRPDVGVYLVNILKPSSSGMTIADQRRDRLQRTIVVDFSVAGEADSPIRLILVMLALTATALVVRRRAPGAG